MLSQSYLHWMLTLTGFGFLFTGKVFVAVLSTLDAHSNLQGDLELRPQKVAVLSTLDAHSN